MYIIYSGVNAQINFTDINPDTTIFYPDTVGGTNYYNLDLNNDGVTDFRIGAKYFFTLEVSHPPMESYLVKVDTAGMNKINTGPYFDGDTISPADYYMKSNWIYGILADHGFVGQWPIEINSVDTYAYMGLEFNHNDTVNYGWVRMKTDGFSFTIDRYAWNETPGQSIIAGQTE